MLNAIILNLKLIRRLNHVNHTKKISFICETTILENGN